MILEECTNIIVQDYYDGLKELDMTIEDVDWFQCKPDEVNYPLQMGNTVAWGFNLVFRFKNRQQAIKKLVIYSQECPIGTWRDHSNSLYHSELISLLNGMSIHTIELRTSHASL